MGAIGCGWAFQSAEWLAEALSPALAGEHALAHGLRKYRRRHRRELLGHSLVAAEFARGKPPALPERLMFSAAARDPLLAAHTEAFAAREIRPSQFLAPWALARAARVNIAGRLHRAERSEPSPA